MVLEMVLMMAALLATGIEAAYVPTEGGGGEFLVRVEPDLVKNASPYTFTSDVPADSRDVRRVKIYVADSWPPAVERSVIEAARRPRAAPVALAPSQSLLVGVDSKATHDKPWNWLIGSLVALFLSLGLNAYLGMLLAQMRQRYLHLLHETTEE
jgi:hypothetical protein